jgi:hypothetical protein
MASLLAIAVGAAGLPPLARVARADDPDKADAKTHYMNAEQAMAEGRYDAAAAEYGIAYEITKDPLIFLKIGNATLAAGKCPAAVVYFKRYLKEGNPPEEWREATQAKIDKCEGTGGDGDGDAAVTTTEAETEPEPDQTETGSGTGTGTGTGTGSEETTETTETTETGDQAPSFLDSKPSWKRSAGWISLGATVIFGTAGAILAMSGESREEDLANLTEFRDANQEPAAYDGNVSDRYEKLIEEGERFNKMSRIAFGAAGVTLVAAVTLLVLDAGSHHGESGSAISLTPVVDHHGGGLAATFGF